MLLIVRLLFVSPVVTFVPKAQKGEAEQAKSAVRRRVLAAGRVKLWERLRVQLLGEVNVWRFVRSCDSESDMVLATTGSRNRV